MATVNFYQPGDMFSPYIWYGVVFEATSSRIGLSDGYRFGYYSGSFSYKSGDLAGGTLTGYTQYIDGALDYVASGAKFSAKTAKAYIDAGDASGLQSLILAGNDILNGSGFTDYLVGHGGGDKIFGNAGDDIISGGLGADTLSGGTGSDIFVFGYFGTAENKSIDVITDFDRSEDWFTLHVNAFYGMGIGILSPDNFALGAKALDANDYIIVNGGKVYFDSDGNGKAKAVQIATVSLVGGGALAASDFFVTDVSP